MYKSEITSKIHKGLTLHIQNTRATENYGQLKPSLQEVELLSAPLLKEQIVLDACTLKKIMPR